MRLTDGYTLMHEHVTIDLSGVKGDEDCRLDCLDETIEEFRRLKHIRCDQSGNGKECRICQEGFRKNRDPYSYCYRILQGTVFP